MEVTFCYEVQLVIVTAMLDIMKSVVPLQILRSIRQDQRISNNSMTLSPVCTTQSGDQLPKW